MLPYDLLFMKARATISHLSSSFPRATARSPQVSDGTTPTSRLPSSKSVSLSFLLEFQSSFLLEFQSSFLLDFQSSSSLLQTSSFAFLVMLGIGPLVLAPVSETFGRRWMLVSLTFLICLLFLPQALAPNVRPLLRSASHGPTR